MLFAVYNRSYTENKFHGILSSKLLWLGVVKRSSHKHFIRKRPAFSSKYEKSPKRALINSGHFFELVLHVWDARFFVPQDSRLMDYVPLHDSRGWVACQCVAQGCFQSSKGWWKRLLQQGSWLQALWMSGASNGKMLQEGGQR